MIGIGVGGAEILPSMEAMDTVDVVAGADVVPATLERFSERFRNRFQMQGSINFIDSPMLNCIP